MDYLYALLSNEKKNWVYGYSIQGSGELKPLPLSPYASQGESGLNNSFTHGSICTDNNKLFTSNKNNHSITVFSIAPDGSLTPIQGSPFPTLPYPNAIAAKDSLVYISSCPPFFSTLKQQLRRKSPYSPENNKSHTAVVGFNLCKEENTHSLSVIEGSEIDLPSILPTVFSMQHSQTGKLLIISSLDTLKINVKKHEWDSKLPILSSLRIFDLDKTTGFLHEWENSPVAITPSLSKRLCIEEIQTTPSYQNDSTKQIYHYAGSQVEIANIDMNNQTINKNQPKSLWAWIQKTLTRTCTGMAQTRSHLYTSNQCYKSLLNVFEKKQSGNKKESAIFTKVQSISFPLANTCYGNVISSKETLLHTVIRNALLGEQYIYTYKILNGLLSPTPVSITRLPNNKGNLTGICSTKAIT